MDKRLNHHHCSTRIQRRPLLTIGLNGTEVRLFVRSVCPCKYFKFKIASFALCMRFFSLWVWCSLLVVVSHDEANMRGRRESLSFLSFLPRRERPLLAGKVLCRLHVVCVKRSGFNQKFWQLMQRCHVIKIRGVNEKPGSPQQALPLISYPRASSNFLFLPEKNTEPATLAICWVA